MGDRGFEGNVFEVEHAAAVHREHPVSGLNAGLPRRAADIDGADDGREEGNADREADDQKMARKKQLNGI